MYKIIGADQKTYGPVSADTIREWIAARRANASTQLQAEGSTDWKPLSEFAEFKDALAAAGGPPPMQRPASAPGAPVPPPPTSGLAIASLVCGIFGCLGITALVGVILGILAMIKINRSQGRLAGQGVAIAGLCVSGVMLISGVPMMAALTIPALAKAKQRAQAIQCVSNLKQLAVSARIYANSSGDKFPQATNWCDALQPHLGSVRVLYCPSDRTSQVSGYGYNAALSGRSVDDVNPSTVLFFETTPGWNVSGGSERLLHRPRHGVVNVAFADGSVRQLRTFELGSLRWRP